MTNCTYAVHFDNAYLLCKWFSFPAYLIPWEWSLFCSLTTKHNLWGNKEKKPFWCSVYIWFVYKHGVLGRFLWFVFSLLLSASIPCDKANTILNTSVSKPRSLQTHPISVQRFCRMSLLPFSLDVYAWRSERWNINYHHNYFYIEHYHRQRYPLGNPHCLGFAPDLSFGKSFKTIMQTLTIKQLIPRVGQNNFLACTGSWSGLALLHCHQIADIS